MRTGLLRRALASKQTWALADQSLVNGTNFVTSVIIGRVALDAELGLYSLGLTLVFVFTLAQQSLITSPFTLFSQNLSPDNEARRAGTAVVHFAALSASAALILAAMAGVFAAGVGPANISGVIAVLAAVLPLVLFREFARRMAYARIQVGLAVGIDLIVALLQIASLALLAGTGQLTAASVYVAMGIATAAAGAVWVWSSRRRLTARLSDSVSELSRSWRCGRWILADQLAVAANVHLLSWLLACLEDASATGIYAACMLLAAMANPFIFGITNVLEPRIAQARLREGMVGVRRVVWQTTGILVVPTLAYAIVLMLLGGAALSFLYGPRFSGHGATLALCALATVASTLAVGPAYGLWALEHTKVNFHASLLGLVTAVILTPVLLATFGVAGATTALLASNIAAAAARWFAFLRLTATSPLILEALP